MGKEYQDTTYIHIKISRELNKQAQIVAKKEHRTVTAVVRMLLEEYIRGEKCYTKRD